MPLNVLLTLGTLSWWLYQITTACPTDCLYLSDEKNSWLYPNEYAMYELMKEVDAKGLQTVQKRETALHFLRRHQRLVFRIMGLWHTFEGYFTMLTLQKGESS